MTRTHTLSALLITLAGSMFTASPLIACDDCGCKEHVHDHEVKAISSDFERDRQAILAMAGEYKVTFQFQETVGVAPDYTLHEPYRSGATEFVEVIEDRGDFISLQHILVVHNKKKDKTHVVKHWRQDWTYQDTDIHAFQGNRTWERVELDPQAVAGTWSQAVYQVDDSPRYESFGKWAHLDTRSSWESAQTWRPLPRREFSHRDDYQVLVARNRHTITPGGWVHEQDNYKLVLDDQGQPDAVLAHESGLNVYDRADNLDLSAGRLYWQQTADYWQDIRSIWGNVMEQNNTFALKKTVDDQQIHELLFALANEVRTDGHSDEIRNTANTTVQQFLISSE